MSPFKTSVTNLLKFLTRELNKIKTVGTLNSYRSAVSLVMGNEIGQNPAVTRFFCGVGVLKPQTPKYEEIWDPEVVLNYLRKFWPHESLSFQDLTKKKLVMLLALTTAQRVQTLSKININNICVSDSEIRIKIVDRIKTSGPGKSQPLLLLPFFKDQTRLCVATVLCRYMQESAQKRPQGEHSLLLTVKKPYRPATSQTISRWLKEIMKESGIDISTFGSHSTRHASTSAAFRKKVDIETIRRAAGWTPKSSVFTRFYNRLLMANGSLAQAIITP